MTTPSDRSYIISMYIFTFIFISLYLDFCISISIYILLQKSEKLKTACHPDIVYPH